MIQFLSGIGNDQNHWAMGNASWFLTLFMGIWLIPAILYKYLSQQGRRFLLVGVIYLIVLTFRSNMMETRVYNELNVVLAASMIICIHNIFSKINSIVKWVIVSCNYGRLGNRLHTHANILAWCITNEYKLSNLSFKSYSELFEKQRYHSSDSYFKTKNIVCYLMKINFICNFIERLIFSKKWMRRLSFFSIILKKITFVYWKKRNLT